MYLCHKCNQYMFHQSSRVTAIATFHQIKCRYYSIPKEIMDEYVYTVYFKNDMDYSSYHDMLNEYHVIRLRIDSSTESVRDILESSMPVSDIHVFDVINELSHHTNVTIVFEVINLSNVSVDQLTEMFQIVNSCNVSIIVEEKYICAQHNGNAKDNTIS